MASKKDFIALEDYLAAALHANVQFTQDNPTMSAQEICVTTDANLVDAVAMAMQKVNPAFDRDLFAQEIEQRMDILSEGE
jgi:hypothetical protein